MYLKNKWDNLSIKRKIFIWSTITIVISFVLLYIFMYIFMPKIYEVYKVSKIHNNVEELREKLETTEDINLYEVFDEFSYDNNVDVLLATKDESNFINNIVYSSMREGTNNPNKIPFLNSYDKDNIFDKHNFGSNSNIGDESKGYVYNVKSRKETLTIQEQVFIKSLSTDFIMIIHAPVSPKIEATTGIVIFFPFAIIVIVVIAAAISILYSLLISKPLLTINEVAKKMSRLNFDNVIEISGEDEIGELSNSLNVMNRNLKESFEQLEEMNSKLTEEIELERKLERERREFVATISHELKSPITIISGQLEGMIYNIGKYKNRDKYLGEAYNVTQKMSELVQEILCLSEREDGNFKYKFDKVNISKVVKEVINELRYFIEEKQLILDCDIEEDVFIIADIKLIKKVINNIVKNAIIYSPAEEQIIVQLNSLQLKVENTGVSIGKGEIKEVFNAFYRVDKSRNRKTGGTGLGLYIVRTVLDKHDDIEYSITSTDNSVIFLINFKSILK